MIAAFALFLSLVTAQPSTNSIYDISLKDIDGKPTSLSAYKGKVMMIVNTASRCGFTSQYEGLQKLYEAYKDKGFVVLAFPSNDFLGQEPGTAEEIKKFCKANYGVTFPLFAKGPVSGKEMQPLFRYLTEESPKDFRGRIAWNFTKFLISKDGAVVARFSPGTAPDRPEIRKAVEEALGKSYTPAP